MYTFDYCFHKTLQSKSSFHKILLVFCKYNLIKYGEHLFHLSILFLKVSSGKIRLNVKKEFYHKFIHSKKIFAHPNFQTNLPSPTLSQEIHQLSI